ncbi:Hypothetical predicted protein, partial [Marmota monax]
NPQQSSGHIQDRFYPQANTFQSSGSCLISQGQLLAILSKGKPSSIRPPAHPCGGQAQASSAQLNC